MFLEYLTCFLMLLFLTYCLKLLLKYLKLRDIINRIPGPPPYFLVGNILDVIGTPGICYYNIFNRFYSIVNSLLKTLITSDHYTKVFNSVLHICIFRSLNPEKAIKNSKS